MANPSQEVPSEVKVGSQVKKGSQSGLGGKAGCQEFEVAGHFVSAKFERHLRAEGEPIQTLKPQGPPPVTHLLPQGSTP